MRRVDAPHSLTPDEVVALLAVDPARGLRTEEVEERRAKFGTNVLVREAGRPAWKILAHQFASLIVLLLAAAAGVALFTGDRAESLAIGVVLLVNALIGFLIEWQAERALRQLRLQTRTTARVRRDGIESMVDAEDLVVGDTIIIEAGAHAPADARLLEAAGLQMEESSLTGESVPASKHTGVIAPAAALPDRSSMIHLGTPATSGRGVAVVTTVGEQTELGKIGRLVRESTDQSTPLERQLARLGRRLVQLVLVIAVIVIAAGVMRGEPLFAMIEFGISLAVAAVPEGLPAVTTLILAVGVLRMARRHAIVRRLPAVETLGSTTVICTDKTGTLTANRLTVRAIESDDAARTLAIGSLCNDAVISGGDVLGDPTEAAIVSAAIANGIDVASLRARCVKVSERPFDHESKRMITIHRDGEERIAALKGAPATVLQMSTHILGPAGAVEALSEERRLEVAEANGALAAQALRVLGIAEQRAAHIDDLEHGYTFLGLVAMADPPREGAAEAIEAARAAGVRVVMLTGDQLETARAIARELHLSGEDEPQVMHASELATSTGGGDITQRVRSTDVFARVSPADKLRIVDDLRRSGEIVAVTGDGVNDAPALRRADIGIAMGKGGTDVARQSADLILTDDNLGTVVDAIRQGRTIYANISRFVHLMFSHNLGEVVMVFAAMVSGLPLPLLPLQILWLNLATDVFPAFALAMEPASPTTTRHPSRPGSLLTRSFVVLVAWQGVMLAAIALAAYIYALSRHGAGDHARTIALTALVAVQLGHTLNCRSRVDSAFRGLTTNPWIAAAFAAVVALQGTALTFPPLARLLRLAPLDAIDWIVIACCAIVPVAIVELQKRFMPESPEELRPLAARPATAR